MPSDRSMLAGQSSGTGRILLDDRQMRQFDLFHRGLANRSGDTRLMIKFLFSRMEEPVRPSWNASQAAWPKDPGEDFRYRQRVWRHQWRWFSGDCAANGEEAAGAADVRALRRDLDHADEWRGLAAAYALGAAGTAGAPALQAALTGGDPVARRRAAYGFGPLGRAGIGDLVEAAEHGDAEVRARTVDVIGDVGLAAGDAVPALERALAEDDHYVRGYAVQALRRIATPRATTALLNHLETARWDPRQDVLAAGAA